MPLSSEDEQRIGNRFDQLINRGNTLLGVLNGNHPIPSYNTVAEYEALVINACNLLRNVLGTSQNYLEYQDQIAEWIEPREADSVRVIIGILRGIKDDFSEGFCVELAQRIATDMTADYMVQAEALLSEGTTGQYDHVPVAVLCGAVLENRLRRWCNAQSPPLSTTQ